MSNYTDFSVKWKFDLVQFCFHKTDILDIKRIIVPEMYVQEVRRLLYDYLELRGMEYERGVLFYIPIEAGTLPIEIGGAPSESFVAEIRLRDGSIYLAHKTLGVREAVTEVMTREIHDRLFPKQWYERDPLLIHPVITTTP